MYTTNETCVFRGHSNTESLHFGDCVKHSTWTLQMMAAIRTQLGHTALAVQISGMQQMLHSELPEQLCWGAVGHTAHQAY